MVPRRRRAAAALADPPRRGLAVGRSSPTRSSRGRDRAAPAGRPWPDPGDPAGHVRAAPRRAASSPPREPLVLFVGSLFNRRRLPDLIAAFALATATPARRPPGHRRGQPHVAARRTWPRSRRPTGVTARTDFRSYIPDAELASLYARASVFALPLRVRRLRPDAARGDGRRRAAGRARHARSRARSTATPPSTWRAATSTARRARIERRSSDDRGARAPVLERAPGDPGALLVGRRRPSATLAQLERIAAPVTPLDRHRQLQRARRSRALPRVADRRAAGDRRTTSSSSTTRPPTAASRPSRAAGRGVG